MPQKTIYTIIGILAVLGLALFIAGFVLVREDKMPGIGPEIIGDSFPFGAGGTTRDVSEKTVSDSGGASTERSSPQEAARSFGLLQNVSARPVAGAVVFSRSGKTILRYIEKQTGHVYEIGSAATRAERISNTTIPGIQKVLWGSVGEDMVFQYIENSDTIKTVSAKITTATSTGGKLSGAFLPDNVRGLAISPNGQNIFYILSLGNAAVGTIASLDGTGRRQIFDSSVTEWIPEWVDTNTIALLTKPSAFSRGFLYTLDSKNGALNKLLGNISGLTALLSKDKNKVLFSVSAGNSFETFLYDVKTRVTVPLAVTTLPEKCAWAKDNVTLYCGAPGSIPAGAYPDLWYQGRVSFADSVWKINTETGALNILASPEDDAREEIDVVDMVLDSAEQALIFRNKKDSSLWSLQL